MTEFDVFARFYDLDFQDHNEDIPFYRNFAQRSGSPILEIGTGTGRVLIPLAQAGYQVTGVDISPAMLDVAKQKVAAADVAQRVELVQADARNLALGKQFAMAFIAANTFMHLTTTADQTATLQSIRNHLLPSGLLLIDVFNPSIYVLTEPDGLVIHDYTRRDPRTGLMVVKFQSRQTDQARQMLQVQFLYDEIGADGSLRRTVAPFTLHYFVYNELSLLLNRSGYRVENVYGSYSLDAYAAQSPRMIFVATTTDG